MNRYLIQLSNPILILIFALIGTAIQTALFRYYPLNYLQPDLILLIVLWLALKRGLLEGGILTLFMARIAEIHSAAPSGSFLLSYILIYLAARMVSKMVVLPHTSSFVLLALATSIAFKLILLGIVTFLGAGANQWRHTLMLLLPGAVVEGALAVWGFHWLEIFDFKTFKDPRSREMLEDELRIDTEAM